VDGARALPHGVRAVRAAESPPTVPAAMGLPAACRTAGNEPWAQRRSA